MSDNDCNFRIIPSPTRLTMDRDYSTGFVACRQKNLKTTDGLQKQYSSTMIAPPCGEKYQPSGNLPPLRDNNDTLITSPPRQS
ncbi:hypothetical protein CEXT_695861 [Caerostris extrusa]|uniref:Uncharacterized protein n=1 Tax=Caerostris extrusa TaxID=172846 RepID=A0AAV4UM90_CAEEX|nr:hypothetical protein CEXT_695861 [Caerostris extrusa]